MGEEEGEGEMKERRGWKRIEEGREKGAGEGEWRNRKEGGKGERVTEE